MFPFRRIVEIQKVLDIIVEDEKQANRQRKRIRMVQEKMFVTRKRMRNLWLR